MELGGGINMTTGTREIKTDKILQGYNGANKFISNWVRINDGRYMSCYFDPTTQTLMTAFSATKDFLTTNYAIDSVVETDTISITYNTTYQTYQTALYKRADNKVLLIVAQCSRIDCYISSTGNGDDWVFNTNIQTLSEEYNYWNIGRIYTSPPQVTPTGRLIYSGFFGYTHSGYWWRSLGVAYSDDNGDTWTVVKNLLSLTTVNTQGVGQLCILPNGDMYAAGAWGSGLPKYTMDIVRSTDNGITWTKVLTFLVPYPTVVDMTISFYYDIASHTLFLSTMVGLYKIENPTHEKIITPASWVFISDIMASSSTQGVMMYLLEGELLIQSPGSLSNNTAILGSTLDIPAGNGGAAYWINGTGAKTRIRGVKVILT